MLLKQYEYNSAEGRKEIMEFISKILFSLHIVIIIVVTITSDSKLATFLVNLSIPIVGRGLVFFSLKNNVNLNWLLCLINGALIFTSCYISGKEAPSWLPGITWLCGMFFLFENRFVRIFWLLYGFVLIGIGSYISGKTGYYILGVEVAFVMFSIILDRTFSFLIIQNKKIYKQKNEIEIKQKEILDSIRYAKRIQQSLLPTEKYIDKKFKDLRMDKSKKEV